MPDLSGWFAAAAPAWPLFVPVALGLGIAAALSLPTAAGRLAFLLAALALAVAALALPRAARWPLLGAGLLLAGGLLLAEWRIATTGGPRLYHRLTAAPIEGVVLARETRRGGERTRLTLARPGNGTDPPHRVQLLVQGVPGAEIRPGAVIRVPGVLGPVPGPAVPGGHDPARRAWFEGIAASGRATGPPLLLEPAPLRPGAAMLDGWRADLEAFLLRALPGDPGAIATALVVGAQGAIGEARLEAFRLAGMAHLLTVSGFHVGVVVAGVLLLVRRLWGLWPWAALRVSGRTVAALAAGAAGIAYALLAGAGVPALRAAIVALVVLAAMVHGRDPLSLRLIALAATLLLLWRPEVLLSPGFQLSFAAVTALALLARSDWSRRWLAPRPGDAVLHRAGRWLLALAATALVAELVLTPIALAHFGRAGAYGVLANVVAVPLTAMLAMPLVALLLVAGALGLEAVVAPVVAPVLAGLGGWATWVAGLPGASWTVPMVPAPAYALLVAGGLLAGLVPGPLRLAGAPLLAAALAIMLAAPRPDLLVSADGRQVALVADGNLWTLRGHRGGFIARSWAEATDLPAGRRLADWPGARCTAAGCAVVVRGTRLLLLMGEDPPPAIAAACAQADLVVAPHPLPPACRPRWALLDAGRLAVAGAVAVRLDARRLDSVADRAGDRPWSPAALPGQRIGLLGNRLWTGVIAE